MRAEQRYSDGMATSPDNPMHPERRGFSIRLPRLFQLIGLGGTILAVGAFMMAKNRDPVVVARAIDTSGNERLTLKYVSRFGSEGMDFHSIVWEKNDGQSWTTKATITKAAFGADSTRRRWISDIHSFDAQAGRCIIRVAEGDVPETKSGVAVIHYIYSWREWDVLRNKELRLIRVCESPFEPFDPAGSVEQKPRELTE